MNVNSDQTRDELWRWRTCVHEAGHAVAAVLLGLPGHGCVVFPNADGLATTGDVALARQGRELPPEYEDKKLAAAYKGHQWPDLLANATMTAAGFAAEDLLLDTARELTRVVFGDRASLEACAREAIWPYCDEKVEVAFAYLASARARVLLTPFTAAIERVARRLDRKSRLTADEVVAAGWPEHSTRKESQT